MVELVYCRVEKEKSQLLIEIDVLQTDNDALGKAKVSIVTIQSFPTTQILRNCNW